jgi:PAS domain S-box-containing protein
LRVGASGRLALTVASIRLSGQAAGSSPSSSFTVPRKPYLSSPLRILIVEDRAQDAELIVAELEHAGVIAATFIRVETAEEFLQQIALSPDVILCDYALPSFGAAEALRLLQERRLDIPFIIVSGSIGEETAVEAIKAGADDYLLKDRLGRLSSAIEQALEENRLRGAAQRAEEDLRQSEFKYRCLFEHLPDAAYLCDATNGKIIDTNQRGERILGLDRAAILGARLEQFIPALVCKTVLATPDFSGEAAIGVSTEVLDAHGRPAPIQILATPLSISKRRLLLAFFREISPLQPRSHPPFEN